MINKKIIFLTLSVLLYVQAGFLFLSSLVSFYYKENDLLAFVISIVITLCIAFLFSYYGKGAERVLSRKDGYVIVASAWVVASIIGMLPYMISGYITDVSDAFFESMSGFTSTGATILDNIESFPHGLLFWRSLTEWIGGLGIVFFTIAVLPMIGSGGVRLFAAEASVANRDKVNPRIGVTAKWIWTIYIGLTISQAFLLFFSGMNVYDSICHALTTCSTGGFSTKQASIAYFQSPQIEYITVVFMFLSGINYSLLYVALLRGKIKRLLSNTEFQWYICIMTIAIAVVTIGLLVNGESGTEESFRKALFQVVAIQTSTGFMSDDYMLWTPSLWMLLSLLMIVGSCAGSTSGGIKCIRIAIMGKVAHNEFRHFVHPNAVIPVRLNRQVVSVNTKSIVLAFIFTYLVVLFACWLLLMALGMNFTEAYGAVVSCLGNTGPALGSCGPAYSYSAIPSAAKWVCSILMLTGRLELFTILLLFLPSFWKRH
ncbi:MAG: TrkH family potassium uptake protein [Phocaeicola sp.]|nr:TrkH family potassium uptake protein [Phocaeicola sp.]